MKALDFLYRYSDLNRKVAELVEKAAIEEQVAKRHCDKELKKECLKKAEEYKSEAAAYKTEQTKMEKLIYAMPQERSRVLRLHYFYGDSLREIARNMHRELDFVENLHNEGMKNLQRILDMEEVRQKNGLGTEYSVFDAETQHAMKGMK